MSFLKPLRNLNIEDEAALSSHRCRIRSLSILQQDLTVLALNRIIQGFEDNWKASTDDVHETHLIEGHIQACLSAVHPEEYRKLRGDITLSHMYRSRGAGMPVCQLKVLFIFIGVLNTRPPRLVAHWLPECDGK
jgi:hypothetical protein